MSDYLNYFAGLVKNAKTFGVYASNGEQRSFILAEKVIDNIGCIDDKALEGFIEFVRLVYRDCRTACKLIEPSPKIAEQTCDEQACEVSMDKAIAEVVG